MIEEDLWVESADEFDGEGAETSSEQVVQRKENSSNGHTHMNFPRKAFRKIVLTKIDEQAITTQFLEKSVEQIASSSLSNNTVAIVGDINQSYKPSQLLSSLTLQVTPTTPTVMDDLWNDINEQSSVIDSSLTEMKIPESLLATQIRETEKQYSLEDAGLLSEESAHTLEHDLWVASEDENKQLSENKCEEKEAEFREWNKDATHRAEEAQKQEKENTTSGHDSFPFEEDDFANILDVLPNLDNSAHLVDFAEMAESDFLSNSFALIDIQTELAELERTEVEEELAARVPEIEQADQSASKRGRGQASGWMGSTSLLYIDWKEGEKAEQEALEKLGYAEIKLSEATRAFVLQAARACKLTMKQERFLTTRLENAQYRLAQLADQDEYTQQRSEAQAEITEIERTLVQNLQWIAIKKARHFLGRGLPLDDLIQYGMFGVIAGIRHYDRGRNAHVMVVVNWWVFQALTRAVCEGVGLIRLPVYLHDSLETLKRRRIELESVLEHPPTYEELADSVQLSVKQVEDLLGVEKRIIPFEYYIKKEHATDGYSFQVVEKCLIAEEERDLPDNENDQFNVQMEIEDLLAILHPREREVIRLRYDLDQDYGEMHSLVEIGKKMHVTRERVRQIEATALKKIRMHLGIQEQWFNARAIKRLKKNKK